MGEVDIWGSIKKCLEVLSLILFMISHVLSGRCNILKSNNLVLSKIGH